jgi:undecaprenyl-diphosphatase
MEELERSILEWVTAGAGRWPLFDRAVGVVAFNDLLKGAVPAAAVWWAWFRPGMGGEGRERRSRLLMGMVATVVALGINRLVATLLPFRPRPLAVTELPFPLELERTHARLAELSAFPSDHAVMFAGLAAAVWGASRWGGVVVAVHALVVVLAPRLYLGLHWPSDLLVGAASAVFLVWGLGRPRLRDPVTRPILAWSERHPQTFYPVLFLGTFLFATLFEGLVALGYLLLETLGHSRRL